MPVAMPVGSIKNRRPMFPLSSDWFSFPHHITQHNHVTFALIAKLTLITFLYSTTNLNIMVRINLKLSIAFLIAAATIVPVVALPVITKTS
jgi:hypothetical protein